MIKIKGKNFKKSCDLTCRFGNILSKVQFINKNELQCESPKFSCPGEITFGISINNKEFPLKNTFKLNIFSPFFFANIEPTKIMNDGKHKVKILGRGFSISKNFYCKFILSANNMLIAKKKAKIISDSVLECLVPASSFVKFNIRILISNNEIDWVDKISPKDNCLQLFVGPSINLIKPNYGKADNKDKNFKIEVIGKNFQCLSGKIFKGKIICPLLKCKFEFVENKENYLIVQGEFINKNLIKCPVPILSRPQVVILRIAIDNKDFTSKNIQFTYFDGFLVEIQPPIISPKGFKIISLLL